MSIPLTIRKNIRDSEPKLKENLERIKAASGKDFEFEADWGSIVGQLADNQKNSIGESYHKEAMGYLAENIEKLCASEMSKEALDEATSSNKIIIRINDKIKNYWAASFENGALVLEHKKALANTYEIRNFDLIEVMPTPGLPLAVRLSIDKFKPTLDEHLETISQLTGENDWQLEVDFEKILPQVEASRHNGLAEAYYREAMGYLVENLKKSLTSETTKESFNEATSQHKIVIEIDAKQKNYWDLTFVDGTLKLTHKPNLANAYEIRNATLEEKIPSPGLPLVTRLNIEQNREKLDEKLEKLNEITGESDWSVEIDFEKFVKTCPDRQKDVGKFYYDECMAYVIQNLEKALKSETTKESFNEATSQHKVLFEINDKQKNYWDLTFADGCLKYTHKPACANSYEIRNMDLEDKIPSPGLPLVTRLNIEKYKENLEENLENIRQTTGESDWAVEADWEKLLKVAPEKKTNAGEFYYKESLGYLAQNLTKALAQETTKEAFNEATSQRKIVFRVNDNPKETKYWTIAFENGELVLTHRKECANTYEIRNFSIESVMPVPGVFSLLARLNIQENQEHLTASLETIKEATGEEYSFDDSCLEEIYKSLKDSPDQIGKVFLKEAMDYLAQNLKKALADDMVKEAFNETASAHQIVMKPDPKQKEYWTIKFENGAVALYFKPGPANLYEIRNFDIEKLL